MAMKGYTAFPKAPALLEPQLQIVWCRIQDTRWGESYPFEEVQSMCSTAPADGAIKQMDQRTRNLMTMHKALHPKDDYMYQERSGEEDLPALETALTHRYNDSRTT